MRKNMTLRNALMVAVCAMTVAAHAYADPKPITIPPGDLIVALESLVKQSGVELVYQTDQLKGMRTRGVSGNLSPQDAVTRLLEGTPLTLRTDPTGAMLIAAPRAGGDSEQRSVPSATTSAADAFESVGQSLRLAQTETPSKQQASDERNHSPNGGQSVIELEEIVVTGSHIRGQAPIGSSLITITRDDIDSSGYSRIEDILAELPQNFGGVNELNASLTQAVTSANVAMGSEIQLRGLGVGTTLTLVNGIRRPAGGSEGTFTDISTIPTAAIERVEVLADGASALYGSDAIGGVVNFILRDDYEGAESRVRLATTDGGAEEMQLSQLFGTHWSSGTALFGYQYMKRGELPASARPLTALGGNFTSLGGTNFRTNPYSANPGTILSAAGEPAYAIPEGQDGTNLIVADLIPASFNAADAVSDVYILPEQEINSAFFSVTQDVGDSLELFSSGMYSTREFLQLTGHYQAVVQVPSSNPFYVNPFGGSGPVRVAYDFSNDLGVIERRGTVDSYGATIGAKARLNHDWQLKFTASGGREQTVRKTLNLSTAALLRNAVNQTDSATALNVFGDGYENNPDTVAAMRRNQHLEGVSDVLSGGLIADGRFFSLPVGDARLAVGADYRRERLRSISSVIGFSVRDSRDVYAVFTELALPILGPHTAQGDARMELSIAARYERYSDFGQTFNPKVGLNWLALPSLKFRGTWGTSFHAPYFSDTNLAFSAPGGFKNTIRDPQSASETSNVLFVTGNNPDLQPEKAYVWTAGLDVAPPSLDGVKFSLTYFDIDYREKIASLVNSSAVLQQEANWAPIITRDPTPEQVAAVCSMPAFTGDCTGPFAAIIDARPLNLAVLEVDGLDATVSGTLQTDMGVLKASIGGTYTFHYDQRVTQNAPLFSVLDTVSFPLSLRLRADASWSFHAWSLGASANYNGSYRNPGAMPDTVGSFTTVNLRLSYSPEAADSWLNRTRFSLGAVNVFDREPPFVNQPAGYDGVNATLLGRLLSLQATKEW